ncbi:ORF113 [Helicoverpa armigera nucleopolyhedrovirus]|uniref:Uncharacterized protein n=2 Tax=Alphabaculovirus helarmigerae TaxID=3047947 RepID=A0A0E3JAZ4_9ABAC|nr:hypothetical protein ORF-108 [Helicoverpa armigera nucleopolyhedrovirus]AJP07668.1 hypothetical protein ORF-109 [Helicoverpa armigera nucleopolyhedrovirus]AJP07804.1 hypothetical protein ORF-109 [Helicoverpa armigera nucleopolyhedrovirus]ALD88546.1 ORF113 [Helicoverpa armigera nucleopolyhedrovirus]
MLQALNRLANNYSIMQLIVFVMHISNDEHLRQDEIYVKYLQHMDVYDAVMVCTGDCLAVCVSSAPIVLLSKNLKIIDYGDLSSIDSLCDKIYDIAEMYEQNQ